MMVSFINGVDCSAENNTIDQTVSCLFDKSKSFSLQRIHPGWDAGPSQHSGFLFTQMHNSIFFTFFFTSYLRFTICNCSTLVARDSCDSHVQNQNTLQTLHYFRVTI